jgi:hypothetical protein
MLKCDIIKVNLIQSLSESREKHLLITPNPQLKVGTALFTGLCSPDGCSEAPMDGFMASR